MKRIYSGIVFILIFASLSYGRAPLVTWQQYRLARRLYNTGRFYSSIKELKRLTKFREIIPSQYLREASLYWIGMAYKQVGSYDSAIKYFEKVRRNYRRSQYYILSYFHMIDSYSLLGKNAKAEYKFKDFLGNYSDHYMADDALFRLAEIKLAQGSIDDVKNYLKKIINKYQSGDKLKSAKSMLNLVNEKAGRVIYKKQVVKVDKSDNSNADTALMAELNRVKKQVKNRDTIIKDKNDEIDNVHKELTNLKNEIKKLKDQLKQAKIDYDNVRKSGIKPSKELKKALDDLKQSNNKLKKSAADLKKSQDDFKKLQITFKNAKNDWKKEKIALKKNASIKTEGDIKKARLELEKQRKLLNKQMSDFKKNKLAVDKKIAKVKKQEITLNSLDKRLRSLSLILKVKEKNLNARKRGLNAKGKALEQKEKEIKQFGK